MKNLTVSLLAIFVTWTALVHAQPVPKPVDLNTALSADNLVELSRGKPVVEVMQGPQIPHKTTRIVGAIDIAAMPDSVWQVMMSCDSALAIVPNIKSCTIIDQGTDDDTGLEWDERQHIVSYGLLFPKTANAFRSIYQPGREIRFARTGGDLKSLEGVWRLDPLADGRATRVTYEAVIAIDQPVPGPLVRRVSRGDTKEILQSLRRVALALEHANGDQP